MEAQAVSPRAIILGLRRLLDKRQADRDLDDEVAHLIELAASEYARQGMSRPDAERKARLEFGGVEAAKEAVRDAGWESHVDTLLQDVRYAWRGLKRTPAFTSVAVLTLALGIGANTAMFSVVNAVILRPLPYADPGQLTLMWTDDTRRGLHQEGLGVPTIADWRAASHSFRQIAYFNAGRVTLDVGGIRERSRAAFASGNLFQTLGVRASLGRPIMPQDEREAAHVAVISYRLWQRRFGGASDVIGKPITTEEVTKDATVRVDRIIGVMPPSFYFPDKATEIWRPSTTYWRFQRESSERHSAWARRWTAVGRLRSGVGANEARAELATIGRRLSVIYPSALPDFPGFAPTVIPILDFVTGRNLQLALWVLLGAVGLVLLVACANVANLLLARATARQHELAVRRALGASRGRLVRQFFVESIVLAALGGAAGLAVAYAGTRLLSTAAAERIPRIDQIAVDWRVLAFAFVVSIVTGLLFGTMPAVRMSGVRGNDVLKHGARASADGRVRHTRAALVVVECALGIVLLAGAGLLLRSLERVNSVQPGFDPAHVLMVRVEFPATETARSGDAAAQIAFARGRAQLVDDLARALRSLSNVEDVGIVDDMFITGRANESIIVGGRSGHSTTMTGELGETSVTPSFFSTMRVPLRAGRELTRDDVLTKIRALYTTGAPERRATREPVLVNEAFVTRYFPNVNPIGGTFCIAEMCGATRAYWYLIVGVVADIHQQGLELATIPQYYTTFLATPGKRADLLLRTRGDPAAVAATARQTILAAVPRALVPTVSTVEEQLGDFAAQRRFQTWILTSFAALAVVLAAVGIYGIVHYSVAERTREIGVRIALGAAPTDVIGVIIRQGMQPPVVGAMIGLLSALAITRLMTHLLFGVAPSDPVTYMAVAAVLTAIALIACYLPARRATRIDPVTALRAE
jgi:putative ABC transport system permease protein